MGREGVSGRRCEEEQKVGCYAQIRTAWIMVRRVWEGWARALFVSMSLRLYYPDMCIHPRGRERSRGRG